MITFCTTPAKATREGAMEIREVIDGYLFAGEAGNKSDKTLPTLRWQLGKFTEWIGLPLLD